MTIEVREDPLTITLPNWVDTNRSYELIWSPITEAWEPLPF